MRKRTTILSVLLCATLAACGGDDGGGGGGGVGGSYLPLGTTLECAGSEKVTGIEAETGNLICGPDTDTDTDTDTMYMAGAGLALDGTTFSVGFADATCPGTQKVSGFSAGAPVCQSDLQFSLPQVPRDNRIATVDTDSARHMSITIGADGFPVISYRESGGTDLRVAKCADTDCSTAPTLTTVDDPDGTDDVGEFTSIAIGPDGNPTVSYYDKANGALKVAKCVDPACAMTATLNVLDGADPTEDIGRYTSLAIGTDGFPLISYYDVTNGNLKAAKCSDAACTSGTNIITTLDGLGLPDVGEYSSIAIGTDGLGVISYFNRTDDTLRVVKCGDAACAVGNALYLVDDGGGDNVGRYTSITIGADGRPVISYRDVLNMALKVARCGDGACATVASVTTVDAVGGDVGEYTSITIGSDGLPIVAYYDATGGNLRTAKCGDAGCTAGNTVVTVDGGFVGQFASITIGSDGLPIIAYRNDDPVSASLRVAKCANPFCLPYWSRR